MAGEDKESVQEQACGCVVLASGKGTRFGGGKLHALFRGKPLIQWALSAVPAELTDRTVVVVGDETIRSLARRHGFRTVENNAPEQGISHSIQLGLAPLQEWCGRVLFLMADQPMLRTETIRNALRLSEEATDRIVALAWNGRRRNPCIFPAKFFPELMSLTGDQGGNAVAARHPSRLLLIEAPWEETEDIDDQETLARLSVQSELRIDPLYPEITMRLYMQSKCFGPGIAALLERVRELGSLRAAAASIGMSYSKAWGVVRRCERALGWPLLVRQTGGRNGGGAVLTADAGELLQMYRGCCRELDDLAERLVLDKARRYFAKENKTILRERGGRT